ncbi:hypothetical protein pb186bvf_012416 [Paramecium bursaria]
MKEASFFIISLKKQYIIDINHITFSFLRKRGYTIIFEQLQFNSLIDTFISCLSYVMASFFSKLGQIPKAFKFQFQSQNKLMLVSQHYMNNLTFQSGQNFSNFARL